MNKLIYICSPFRGDYETNTKNAIRYSAAAFAAGYIPVTPHIYFPQFMDDRNPVEREKAMQAGEQLLLRCSEVWAFGLDHPSEGMSSEIAIAERHGIPVRDGTEEILKRTTEITMRDDIPPAALEALADILRKEPGRLTLPEEVNG